jgi:glucose-1-phosphate cytidylyltransferase
MSGDTLKDKQLLEDLVDKGTMPWRLNRAPRAAMSDAERRIG